MIFQIRDWKVHFENDRSRQRDKCSFVCVPNKQHGMGFCRIMAEPDGAAIYGIWHMIVGACSQQKNRDGWLTADGEAMGTPWGVDDLALKFRRPEAEIERAIQVVCSEKVGWMIKHDSPPTHHALTADSPPGTLKERKKGKKEGKGIVAPATPPHPELIPRITYADVFKGWNAEEKLVKCLVVSDSRRRKIDVRLNDQFFAANWQAAIKKVSASLFCLGQNEKGWRATFDWFIQPDVVPKIMEGKYDKFTGNNEVSRPNHRNEGIVRGPTNYATARPRLQREREAEAARLAGKVAPAQGNPPPTVAG